jgi:hypothetical protein
MWRLLGTVKMGTTVIVIVARWPLFVFLFLYLSYFDNWLRQTGGGAVECYIGINLRSKTSWQHPVQNLMTSCTKPHDSTLYKTSWQHPVQYLMTTLCTKPHDNTLYKTSWQHPVQYLNTTPCTKPHYNTLSKCVCVCVSKCVCVCVYGVSKCVSVQVPFQVSTCVVCVGQSGTVTVLSPSTSAFPCQYHSTTPPHSSINNTT